MKCIKFVILTAKVEILSQHQMASNNLCWCHSVACTVHSKPAKMYVCQPWWNTYTHNTSELVDIMVKDTEMIPPTMARTCCHWFDTDGIYFLTPVVASEWINLKGVWKWLHDIFYMLCIWALVRDENYFNMDERLALFYINLIDGCNTKSKWQIKTDLAIYQNKIKRFINQWLLMGNPIPGKRVFIMKWALYFFIWPSHWPFHEPKPYWSWANSANFLCNR